MPVPGATAAHAATCIAEKVQLAHPGDRDSVHRAAQPANSLAHKHARDHGNLNTQCALNLIVSDQKRSTAQGSQPETIREQPVSLRSLSEALWVSKYRPQGRASIQGRSIGPPELSSSWQNGSENESGSTKAKDTYQQFTNLRRRAFRRRRSHSDNQRPVKTSAPNVPTPGSWA